MIDKVKAAVIASVVFVIGFQVFFALIKPYLPLVGQTLAYAFVVLVIVGIVWLVIKMFSGGGGGGGLMRGR